MTAPSRAASASISGVMIDRSDAIVTAHSAAARRAKHNVPWQSSSPRSLKLVLQTRGHRRSEPAFLSGLGRRLRPDAQEGGPEPTLLRQSCWLPAACGERVCSCFYSLPVLVVRSIESDEMLPLHVAIAVELAEVRYTPRLPVPE
jgi:hypothetical protein